MPRPGSTNETLLMKALLGGDDDGALAIVTTGINPAFRDIDGSTLVMRATESECVQTIRALVKAGCDVDAVHPVDGKTALMAAIETYAFRDVVETLLDCGADPEKPDLSGRTATDLAFTCRNLGAQAALTAHKLKKEKDRAAEDGQKKRLEEAEAVRRRHEERLRRLDALAVPRQKRP